MHSKNETNHDATNRIFYWNGILDPKGLTAFYDGIITKILDGDWQNLDLEKLHGHNVYSVRVNLYDRLLFTTIVVDDQPWLMLLDEVLNHDYAKSRFLKPAVLKNYIELHGQAISEKIIHEHFSKLEENTVLVPKRANPAIEYSRIDFYNQKYIELDETQLKAATKKSLPLIISGAPGSGKSCIALLILGQYIETNCNNEFPILYVTESKNLASSMQHAWLELPISQNLDANAVQFKSYQELIEDLTDAADNKIFVDKIYCINWLANHIKQSRKLSNQSSFNEGFFSDINLMYQEFRIISGCANYETYEKIGKKQSLFQNASEQQWLFAAYIKYQEHLEDNKAIHIPFYTVAQKDLFKLIVIDEAQDLSHLQLKTLADLACNKQICFCEDNRQSLADNKSKIPYLKKLMYSWGKKDNQVTLTATYRCPEAAIAMANAVASLKSKATGHGQEEIMLPSGQTNKGTVKWFDTLKDDELAALQEAASSPDFAIITSKEYKDDAKKLFMTPLVFTPDEIKGLEYKKILAWRLFDDPLFKEADKLIGEQSPEFDKKPGHHAKANQGNDLYGPAFNAVYTAFTRTTDTLYIVQEKHHYLPNIITCLTTAIPVTIDQVVATTTTTSTTVSASQNHMAEWFTQVKIQLGFGNVDIAKDIYIKKLNKSAEEFEAFKMPFINSACPSMPVEKKINKPSEKISISNSVPVSLKSRQSKTVIAATAPQQVQIPEKAPTIKFPEPVEKLLRKVTENTLCTFLRHKKAKEYLFDVLIKNQACLFTLIFFTTEGRSALLSCMGMAPFKKIFEKLPEQAFCQPCPETSDIPNVSPFWLISKNIEELKQFKILLGKIPAIANTVTAKALCLPVYIEGNRSPLYYLSKSNTGWEVLDILLAKNPQLAENITAEALCLAINTTETVDKNTSPLYYLAQSNAGLKILKTLFDSNPQLAAGISASALCLQRAFSSKDFATRSPLFYLSMSNIGITLLSTMFTKNPALLASDILGHAMCQQLPADIKNMANASPFYLLASLEEGKKILKSWLANPESSRYVNASTLCQPVLGIQAKYTNVASLYWLAIDCDGQSLLHTILINNPEIAKLILTWDLCRPCQSTNKLHNNTTPLSLLSVTIEGRKILEILCISNPKLAEFIKGEEIRKSTLLANSFFSTEISATTTLDGTVESTDLSAGL